MAVHPWRIYMRREIVSRPENGVRRTSGRSHWNIRLPLSPPAIVKTALSARQTAPFRQMPVFTAALIGIKCIRFVKEAASLVVHLRYLGKAALVDFRTVQVSI